ncbi:MAG: hypothetical protein PWQ35_363 [Patescibacteria group bacterium]|nr:hypothetical protein [Patescibacteria group bacterium]
MFNTKDNNRKNEVNGFKNPGFVIDLRAAFKETEKQAEPKISDKKKLKQDLRQRKISTWFASFLKKRKKTQKNNLNLNFWKEQITSSKNKNNFFLHSKRQKKADFHFEDLFKKKKKNSWWEKAIKEKRKILNTRFYYKPKKMKQLEENLIWYRSLFSFALILLFLVVPLKVLSYLPFFDVTKLEERVMTHSQAAVSKIEEAAGLMSEFDFIAANNKLSLAGEEFLQAEDNLRFINDSLLSLATLSHNPKIKMAAESKHILEAGVISTELAQNLVTLSDTLFNYKENSNLLEVLATVSEQGNYVYQDVVRLEKVITEIKTDNLPLEYRQQFIDLKDKVVYLRQGLFDFISLLDSTHELLGKTQDKRYLLIFQNNSELRGAGGFLGSFAIVDLRAGEIKNLEVPAGGSYDTEGGMTLKVKAPEPLWLVNPAWHFWDANWWPDWPTTAQNLMWFYEKSGGSTVDGVITFTPTVVENLLAITGPIDMSAEYGVIITSENFWEIVQKIVEKDNLALTHPETIAGFKESNEEIVSSLPLYQDLENNAENKPKKIIGDLMARILEVLPTKMNKDNLLDIIALFENSVSSKNLMFYFSDKSLQKESLQRGLAGEIKAAPHDYLLVVNTNIAGQKTDRKMKESIFHYSQVDETGKIVNNLNIKRAHEGLKNEALTGVRNVNWLRIYVPLGSRLLSASGFSMPDASYFEAPEADWYDSELLAAERVAVTDAGSGLKIYQENGKTVFAGWVMTDPGQTADVKISYVLPFNFFHTEQKTEINNFWEKINNLINKDKINYLNYSLLVQKQPGAKASDFQSTLKLPNNLELLWSYPDNLTWKTGWNFSQSLDRDKYFSLLLNNLYDKR